jgi:capsular exopolysaccharide synthesis family protein
MKKNGQKLLLVSSVEENEGKSTVASNIALAMAQSGKKVILLDMDMRRPAIYKIFDIEAKNKNGFWKEEISISGHHTMQLYLNNKTIKNPAVFIKERGIGALLEHGREKADIIIIDSPPMNAAADTELVLSYADASVLVVRKDWVHMNDLNRAIGILGKGDTDFLGYVLNDYEIRKPVSRAKNGYYYGYEYGTYRKEIGR